MARRCRSGSAATEAHTSPSVVPGTPSVECCSGSWSLGTARRLRPRTTSMALRPATRTSHASTSVSSARSGQAWSAATNVSDQASSASAPGPSTARHTRSTVAPCCFTAASNGRLIVVYTVDAQGGPDVRCVVSVQRSTVEELGEHFQGQRRQVRSAPAGLFVQPPGHIVDGLHLRVELGGGLRGLSQFGDQFLGDLPVVFVADLVLESRPEVHGGGADLQFDPHLLDRFG